MTAMTGRISELLLTESVSITAEAYSAMGLIRVLVTRIMGIFRLWHTRAASMVFFVQGHWEMTSSTSFGQIGSRRPNRYSCPVLSCRTLG